MARKRGTRKRSTARRGAAAVDRVLRAAGRPVWIGRWAGSALPAIPGLRSKRRRR